MKPKLQEPLRKNQHQITINQVKEIGPTVVEVFIGIEYLRQTRGFNDYDDHEEIIQVSHVFTIYGQYNMDPYRYAIPRKNLSEANRRPRQTMDGI